MPPRRRNKPSAARNAAIQAVEKRRLQQQAPSSLSSNDASCPVPALYSHQNANGEELLADAAAAAASESPASPPVFPHATSFQQQQQLQMQSHLKNSITTNSVNVKLCKTNTPSCLLDFDDDNDDNYDDYDDAELDVCLHCHCPAAAAVGVSASGSASLDDATCILASTTTNVANSSGIQVQCDECQAYICQKCHWCHEFQANHEIRVCDRCDAVYCRNCDEMDQCDDCGEVVCASCSTLLSCKFCGGGLCEECATACGRCGIVLCSRDAKFAVDCDTCRLSYCLVCLASGSKDPCVRCGQRPSKRMEQLVHLRLKSIYKAFKQSSRSPKPALDASSTVVHDPSPPGGNPSTDGLDDEPPPLESSSESGASSNLQNDHQHQHHDSNFYNHQHHATNLNAGATHVDSVTNSPWQQQQFASFESGGSSSKSNLVNSVSTFGLSPMPSSSSNFHHHSDKATMDSLAALTSSAAFMSSSSKPSHHPLPTSSSAAAAAAAAGFISPDILAEKYMAEKQKADAAAEALLAELEEEEEAQKTKKSKKKRKKEKQRQHRLEARGELKRKEEEESQLQKEPSAAKEAQTVGEDCDMGPQRSKQTASTDARLFQSLSMPSPASKVGRVLQSKSTKAAQEEMGELPSSSSSSAKHELHSQPSEPPVSSMSQQEQMQSPKKKNMERSGATRDGQNHQELDEVAPSTSTPPQMDPIEKQLCTLVDEADIGGIEDLVSKLKGVPGRAVLRKNAKKALKRFKCNTETAVCARTLPSATMSETTTINISKVSVPAGGKPKNSRTQKGAESVKPEDPSRGNIAVCSDSAIRGNSNPMLYRQERIHTEPKVVAAAAHQQQQIHCQQSSKAPAVAMASGPSPELIRLVSDTNISSSKQQNHYHHHHHHHSQDGNRAECILEIAPFVVGWIIGRGGQRIRDLMEETGAKVWIEQERAKPHDNRNVYVTGERTSVDHAVRRVKGIVLMFSKDSSPATSGKQNTTKKIGSGSDNKTSPATAVATTAGDSTAGTATTTTAGTVGTTTLTSTSTHQYRLRDFAPETTKNEAAAAASAISDQFGKFSSLGGTPAVVNASTVPGSGGTNLLESSRKQDISRTVENVLPVVVTPVAAGKIDSSIMPAIETVARNSSRSLANASEKEEQHYLTCEPRFVPLLIGRRGWTIKHIQDESGARIDINQSVTPRQIRISGVKENVSSAIRMVRHVLSYPHAQVQQERREEDAHEHREQREEQHQMPSMASPQVAIIAKQTKHQVRTPVEGNDKRAASFSTSRAVQSGGNEGGNHIFHSTANHDGVGMNAAVATNALGHHPNETQDHQVEERNHSPPPYSLIMTNDAKSQISATSSLSSTPEPSMASTAKGCIPSQHQLSSGPLLPPASEFIPMNRGNSHHHHHHHHFTRPPPAAGTFLHHATSLQHQQHQQLDLRRMDGVSASHPFRAFLFRRGAAGTNTPTSLMTSPQHYSGMVVPPAINDTTRMFAQTSATQYTPNRHAGLSLTDGSTVQDHGHGCGASGGAMGGGRGNPISTSLHHQLSGLDMMGGDVPHLHHIHHHHHHHHHLSQTAVNTPISVPTLSHLSQSNSVPEAATLGESLPRMERSDMTAHAASIGSIGHHGPFESLYGGAGLWNSMMTTKANATAKTATAALPSANAAFQGLQGEKQPVPVTTRRSTELLGFELDHAELHTVATTATATTTTGTTTPTAARGRDDSRMVDNLFAPISGSGGSLENRAQTLVAGLNGLSLSADESGGLGGSLWGTSAGLSSEWSSSAFGNENAPLATAATTTVETAATTASTTDEMTHDAVAVDSALFLAGLPLPLEFSHDESQHRHHQQQQEQQHMHHHHPSQSRFNWTSATNA